ncbi:hypothetical protein CANCADRAFT_95453 [Tortispora caseinolytica NRRL Y-17796]|uniref:Enoyl reductase (ER) domain-containing protein n=1 Tax=Tortispora caseinolytica NRRL Y-17796 TaxID=767744 RepID=A0A1E4TME7_9ASCO|nr:hypothetical protein CANCADRAFT_95453 [Tortispora caseinolytica NRRL Y-17796]
MTYPETIDALGVVDYDKWPVPSKFSYKPREFRENDVDIQIDACAICGSDIHAAKGGWGRPYAPVAVGHEIIGKVVKVGSKASSNFKIGDRVGVGARCFYCQNCDACDRGFENNCENKVSTYFGVDKESGVPTQGGDASHIRVDGHMVFHIPDSLETNEAAPLLCGGITGFAPLLDNNVTKGTKIGIVGVGGIGHMAIQFAKALGAEVTAISRTRSKEEDAKKLGATHFVASGDPESMKEHKGTLDIILNTSSSLSQSAIDPLVTLLRARGTIALISFPPADEKIELSAPTLLLPNLTVKGSALGTPEQTQYMLNFAAEHNIKPWVETFDINEKNLSDAWVHVESGKVRYRAVMTGFDKFFGDSRQ